MSTVSGNVTEDIKTITEVELTEAALTERSLTEGALLNNNDPEGYKWLTSSNNYHVRSTNNEFAWNFCKRVHPYEGWIELQLRNNDVNAMVQTFTINFYKLDCSGRYEINVDCKNETLLQTLKEMIHIERDHRFYKKSKNILAVWFAKMRNPNMLLQRKNIFDFLRREGAITDKLEPLEITKILNPALYIEDQIKKEVNPRIIREVALAENEPMFDLMCLAYLGQKYTSQSLEECFKDYHSRLDSSIHGYIFSPRPRSEEILKLIPLCNGIDWYDELFESYLVVARNYKPTATGNQTLTIASTAAKPVTTAVAAASLDENDAKSQAEKNKGFKIWIAHIETELKKRAPYIKEENLDSTRLHSLNRDVDFTTYFQFFALKYTSAKLYEAQGDLDSAVKIYGYLLGWYNPRSGNEPKCPVYDDIRQKVIAINSDIGFRASSDDPTLNAVANNHLISSLMIGLPQSGCDEHQNVLSYFNIQRLIHNKVSETTLPDFVAEKNNILELSVESLPYLLVTELGKINAKLDEMESELKETKDKMAQLERENKALRIAQEALGTAQKAGSASPLVFSTGAEAAKHASLGSTAVVAAVTTNANFRMGPLPNSW